jgi:LacI family transcriptional regulator
MNINEMARKLGVAKSTVSKAMNNRPDVGKGTRERVLKLAGKSHYTPNPIARSLVSRKSRTLGIVMHEEQNDAFFAPILRSLTEALREQGYSTVFASSAKSAVKEKDIIGSCLDRLVEGVVLVPCRGSHVRFINAAVRQGMKFVIVDHFIEGIHAPFVGTDFARGAYLAVRHLLECGHRQIGHLGGPLWAASTGERISGYRQAYREAGIPVPEKLVVNCDYDEPDARSKFMSLKQGHPEMTAILSAGVPITEGALSALSELELDVPRDMSLVDFGSATFISSLDQKAGEMGRTAARLLLSQLNGSPVPPKTFIDPELALRNSTRRCGKAAA